MEERKRTIILRLNALYDCVCLQVQTMFLDEHSEEVLDELVWPERAGGEVGCGMSRGASCALSHKVTDVSAELKGDKW